MIVPQHIKDMMDRIIKVYEKLYQNYERVYLNIVVGDTVYSGIETTKYYLDDAKNFRKELDNCEGPIFEGKDEEIIRKIFLKVNSYFTPLGCPDTDSVLKSVICQEQLKKALKKAEKREDIAEEANLILKLIENGQRMSWGHFDANIERRIFKLVKTKEEFLKLSNIEEVTEEGLKIRVAFKEKYWHAQCEEKSILRKSNYMLKHSKNFSDAFECFNFWYDIKRTGIYYVYIPEQ